MSTEPLAACRAEDTVKAMTTKRRSPVVARFEIVSNDPAAGEAYRHAVTVEKSGRVRSVVECVEREETVQEWPGDEPPTLGELADLLVVACHDEYHESRVRLLSAVVHGLLPQGNYLWEESAEIPDAVLDGSLGFGPRTTYRAEIQKALVTELRGRTEVAWAVRIQSVGADEHEQFARQIAEAASVDQEWLRRSLRASRSGEGTPYDDLVARTAPAAAKDDVATSEPPSDAPVTIYWDDYAGGSFSLVPSGWVEENVSPLREIAQAKTWGEVRKIQKPFWLERLVEDRETDREDEGLTTTDETPFQGADLGMDMGSFLDCMVAPWNLESLVDWFPAWDWDIIEKHCRTGGASPGGHIDVYKPEDRDEFLAALRSRGYRVEHRDFLDDLERALNGFSRLEPAPSSDEATPAVLAQAGVEVVEMGGPTRKVVWVGPYATDWHAESAELLVMSDETYDAIDRRNSIASKAQSGGESWSSLVEQFGRDEVESVLGSVIQDARHLLEEEEIDESDEAMQKCLDAAKESDMWPYAYQPLDDADVILAGLPAAVVELVRPQSVSPMTDYSPCSWDTEDLPRIRELLAEAGWEVRSTTFHPAWP